MIIWLASYPRSGNTLLRIVLKRCFGLDSYSIYSDQEFANPAVQQMVGEKPIGPDAKQFLRQSLGEGRLVCVKTHELPAADTHRTIYLVRDGRAALVSHFHFQRKYFRSHVSLDGLIKGIDAPSWSHHVNAWTRSDRPNLLTLRYEDLARADQDVQDAIAAFIGRKPIRPFDVGFPELHALMPGFFRSGSNHSNIAELTAEQLDLFRRLHGVTLEALGYPPVPAVRGERHPARQAVISGPLAP